MVDALLSVAMGCAEARARTLRTMVQAGIDEVRSILTKETLKPILTYISPISPPYLPDISPISRRYLPGAEHPHEEDTQAHAARADLRPEGISPVSPLYLPVSPLYLPRC